MKRRDTVKQQFLRALRATGNFWTAAHATGVVRTKKRYKPRLHSFASWDSFRRGYSESLFRRWHDEAEVAASIADEARH